MSNQIQDHGQIKLLSLPDEFQEVEIVPADEKFQTSSIREFQVEGVDDTRFCLYYRGVKLSEAAGKKFSSLLSGKPHVLQNSELSEIKEVLDDVAYPDIFNSLLISTENLNDKIVLKVEGSWIRQDWNMYAIYIDAEGDGCIVQQVYFLAPPSSYLRFISGIKSSIKNIEWSH